MARTIRAALIFLALLGLYLFLAGEISAVEIVAGLLCAAAGTALATGLGVVAKWRFGAGLSLGAIGRPLASLLPDTLAVAGELIGAIVHGASGQRGAFAFQPFDPGADDPRSATRRAVTLVGISLAPRTFMVRGERDEALLLHSLPAKPPSAEREWPA